MISQPLFVVIVAGLLVMLLLWSAIRKLVRDQTPIAQAFPQATMRDILKVLIAAPLVVTAVHLAAVSILGYAGDLYAQFSQGLFYLGWWAAVTIMVFSQVTALRSTLPLPITSVIGTVVSVTVLALFSSSTRFMEVFSVDGYDRAIITGLALILMAYTVLRRLWNARPAK